ncbi:hypothetical protein GCM10009735_23040 [Actinomadura chokoriensis]
MSGAWVVRVWSDSGRVVLSRRPVGDAGPSPEQLADEHLVVEGADHPWAPVADVLVHRAEHRPVEFHGLVACAVEPGRCVIRARGEREVVVGGPPSAAVWVASVAHFRLVAGGRLGALTSLEAGLGSPGPGRSPVPRR